MTRDEPDKLEKRKEIEKPEEIIDDITANLDKLHKGLTESATLVGQEIERYENIRPAWKIMSETQVDNPDIREIYNLGVCGLSAFRDELTDNWRISGLYTQDISRLLSSSDTTAAITSSSATVFQRVGEIKVPYRYTLPRHQNYGDTKAKLEKIDPSLCKTFESIREIFYGTRYDPERAAEYQSRQVFDHLFSILAPDDKVRKSPYWKRKTGNDSNLVTRPERIAFAANTHVTNKSTRQILVFSSKHMLSVYKVLCKAHNRGPINEQEAKEALREMFQLICDWVNEVDLESLESVDASTNYPQKNTGNKPQFPL